MNFLTEEIEYLIDNNLFFEKNYLHSYPIHIEKWYKVY